MNEQEEYGSSLERDEQGTYYWTGIIDRQYDRKIYKIMFGWIGGVLLFFVGVCIYLNPAALSIVLPIFLGIMALVVLVTVVMVRLTGGGFQDYEMNEEYVHYVSASPKADTYFRYKDIRLVRVYPARNMMEIKGIIVGAPFFVPPEDFRFVRNYILQRVPDYVKVVEKD